MPGAGLLAKPCAVLLAVRQAKFVAAIIDTQLWNVYYV